MEGEYGRSLQEFLNKMLRLGVNLILEEGDEMIFQLEGHRVIISKRSGVLEAKTLPEIDVEIKYRVTK